MLVDKNSLANVLTALNEVCQDKAVKAYDNRLNGDKWRKAGEKIAKVKVGC